MSLASVHAALGHKGSKESGLFERQAQRVGVREHRQFLILRKRCCRPLSISVKWRQDQLSRKMPSDLLVWIFTNKRNLLKPWLFFFLHKEIPTRYCKGHRFISQVQHQPAHQKPLSMITKALFSKIVIFKEHQQYTLKGGHLVYLLLRAF